jgi:hypothetical protein
MMLVRDIERSDSKGTLQEASKNFKENEKDNKNGFLN